MTVLADVMNTRYITDAQQVALANTLQLMKGPIDLKGCKFSPSSERVLREYCTTHSFCNSTNEVLDAYLKHNMNLVPEESVVSEPLQFKINTTDELVQFLKDLDQTKVYNLNGMDGPATTQYRALVVLIQMKFPNVVFDLGYRARTIFDYVRREWLKTPKKHQAYWEEEKSSLWRREVVDGKVYIPGVGEILEDVYIQKYRVLPYEFGTTVLWRNPEFKEVETAIFMDLQKKVKVVKRIEDYIEMYE